MNKNFIIFGIVMILLSGFVSAMNFNTLLDFYLANENATDSTSHYSVTNTNAVTFGIFGKNNNASGNYNGATNKRYVWVNNTIFGNYSCSVWVNISSAGSANREVIIGTANSVANNYAFFMEKGDLGLGGSMNRIGVVLQTTLGTSALYNTSVNMNDNLYHHYVITRNGSRVALFVDGKFNGTANDAGGNSNTFPYQRFAQGRPGEYDGLYNSVSDIDELACWNYSFSDVEALYLYNLGSGVFYPFSGDAVFELTAKNIYNSYAITNFTATITNATTTQTITTTNGTIHFGMNQLVNISIFNVSNYFNLSYTNYNTSTNLNAELTPFFYYHDVAFSNYTNYNLTNYTRTINYAFNLTCKNGTTTTANIYVNDTFKQSKTLTCYDSKQLYNYSYANNYEGNVSFKVNITSIESNNISQIYNFLYWDLYAPVISVLSLSEVSVFSNQLNASLRCVDSASPILLYNLTAQTLLFYGNVSNNYTQSNTTATINGENTVYGSCSDFFSSNSSSTTSTGYLSLIWIIDEITNQPFNSSNISGSKLYYSDTEYYDFKLNNASQVNISSLNNTKLRLALDYSTGETINRYIDISLLSSNVRICANKEGVTHYQQLAVSGTEKAVSVLSTYANCYVVADYTRFAYEQTFSLAFYTIASLYYLDTLDDGSMVRLASIDGSLSSSINIDVLQFNKQGYAIALDGDGLSFYKFSNDTVKITYLNNFGDNDAATLTITDITTGTQLYSEILTNPNEYVLYFDYGYYPIANNTLFKLQIAKTKDGETTNLKRYFDPNGASGVFPAALGAVFWFITLFLGISSFAAGAIFGWLGIIILIFGLILLGLSVQTAYIVFFEAISLILIIFIGIIISKQTQNGFGN